MWHYLDSMRMITLRCQFNSRSIEESTFDLFAINFQVQARGHFEKIEALDLWNSLLKSLPFKINKDEILSLDFSVEVNFTTPLTNEITLYPIFNRSLIEVLDLQQLNYNEQLLQKKLRLYEDEYLCLRSLIIQTNSNLEISLLIKSLPQPVEDKYKEILEQMIVYYFTNFHFELDYRKLNLQVMKNFTNKISKKCIGMIGHTWRNFIIFQILTKFKAELTLFKSSDEPKCFYSPTYVQSNQVLQILKENDITFKDYKPKFSDSFFLNLESILESSESEQVFNRQNEDYLLFMTQNAFTEFTTVKELKQYLASGRINKPIIFNNDFKLNTFVREIKSIKSIQVKDKVLVKCLSKKFEFHHLIVGDSNEFINSLISKQGVLKDNPSFDPFFIHQIKSQFTGLKISYMTKAICRFTSTFWPENFIRHVMYENSLMIIYAYTNDSLLIELHKPYKEIEKKYEQHKKEIIKILQETFQDQINRDSTKYISLYPCDYFIQSDFKEDSLFLEQNVYFNIPVLQGDGINLLTRSIINGLLILRDIFQQEAFPEFKILKQEENALAIQTFGLDQKPQQLPFEFKKNNFIISLGNENQIYFQSIISLPSMKNGDAIFYYFTIIEDNMQRKIYIAITEDDQNNIIMKPSVMQLYKTLTQDAPQQHKIETTNNIEIENPQFKFPNIYPELLWQGKIDNYATNEMLHRISRYCMGSLFLGLEHPIIKLLRKSMKFQGSKFPAYFLELIKKPLISEKFQLCVKFDDSIKITRRFLNYNSKGYIDYHITISNNQEIFIEELSMTEKNTKEIWDHMYFNFINVYNMKYFYQEMVEFINGEMQFLGKFTQWNNLIEQFEKQRVFIPSRLQIPQSDLLYSNMKIDDTFEIVNGKLLLCQKGNRLNLKETEFSFAQ